MHEQTLKNFFQDDATLEDLLNDMKDSVPETNHEFTHEDIIDMNEDFEVTSEHLVMLCDEFLSGEIDASIIEAIGSCTSASDHFYWDSTTHDGHVISEVSHMWASPDTNYPINDENMMKFREYLMTAEYPFED